MVSTTSVAVTPSRVAPTRRSPTTGGISIEVGWPSIAGLRLDAAHAPAEHAEAVDHGGVRVGADDRVEEGHAVAVEDHPGEVLQVDLVADAHARGHDAEVLEGALGPLEEGVALDVALVLDVDVLVEAGRRSRSARR